MRKRMIGRVALLVLFGALSPPALGADQRDLAACPGGPHIAVEAQISACTALIKDKRLRPNDLALAYLKRGNAYGATGKLGLAIADFDQAIRLNVKFFEAYANRGLTYAKQQRYERAIRDYNQAIKLNPHIRMFVNRGAAYDALGQHDAAIRDFDKAIAEKPDDEVLFRVRGLARLAKHDYVQAIADFDRAIELKADNANAFNQRCWARAAQGKELQRALLDCNEALRLRPDYTKVRDSRAFVHYRLNRFNEAIADTSAVLKVNPKFASSLYVRGLAKHGKGDRKGSTADIAAAKAHDPKVAEEFAGYGIPAR